LKDIQALGGKKAVMGGAKEDLDIEEDDGVSWFLVLDLSISEYIADTSRTRNGTMMIP
jgi:hypothetical protein